MLSDWLAGTFDIMSARRKGKSLPLFVVGIINLTSDSFFESYRPPEDKTGFAGYLDASLAACRTKLDQGADMLDLGAESTRPGATPISAEQEIERLMPVLHALRASRPDALISVDSYHAPTVIQALECGVHMVNDISACGRDPAMLEALSGFKPAYVLMHGDNQEFDRRDLPVVDRVCFFFEKHIQRLTSAGLPEKRIVLDPGVGFGKTSLDQMYLLKNIDRLHCFGLPLYVGLSMKSMFGEIFGLALEDRQMATTVSIALLAKQGVCFHRVHDVPYACQALQIAREFGDF
jgi:dihydropteroate synthase